MKKLSISLLILSTLTLSNCGLEYIEKEAPPPNPAGPEIGNILMELVDKQETQQLENQDFTSTSLKHLITLGTPEGIRLHLRYTELGIPLVDALKTAHDDTMIGRLFDLAKFASLPQVRAESLVSLSQYSDPKDLDRFKTAIDDPEMGIRLAAVEALQTWKQAGGKELLLKAVRDPWSPLLRVFAAQALLSQGEESAREVLHKGLQDSSWIIRAMSARYLGDYGIDEDYDRIYQAFQRENRNDFVVAELGIATLKILSKKSKEISYTPFQKGWKSNEQVSYTVGQDSVIEVEPLVIIPPRMHLPENEFVTQSLNNKLISLIQTRVDVPLDPIDENDPNRQDLFKLLTPSGFALQQRYSELGLLLVEGLGGTSNQFIRTELIRFSEQHPNSLVRASALIALSYNKDPSDIRIIQNNLEDLDPIVRFGAMEAILVGRFKEALPSLSNIAYTDPIPAFRVYARYIYMAFGDPLGRDLMITNLYEPDWPARAMTYWYLGRYGKEEDYYTILTQLSREDNPFVKAEIALAATRLAPL